MRHLINITDLSVDEIDMLLNTAEDIIKNPGGYAKKCEGKKLATLFFEPSTRTRLSFEAAMYELGGNVIGFSSANASSTAKGESVTDTICTVSNYADIIAMRHPYAGAPIAAMESTRVPIINAGDGDHYHPTQTLADLLTIHREKGRFNNLTIGLCGDLLYGRTVHSLIEAMIRYENNSFVLICPDELMLPDYVIKELNDNNVKWSRANGIEDAAPDLDILYMTRVQKERFIDEGQYERLKDSYILDEEKMKFAGQNMIVMHPLPRVNEISIKVDKDKRACYFKQVLNGKFMRMALILMLLDEKNTEYVPIYKRDNVIKTDRKCLNPKCITATIPEIEQFFIKDINGVRCAYCEK